MLYIFIFRFSLRRTAERLLSCFIKRNHVSIWNWIQKFKLKKKIMSKKNKILEYVIDETLIKVGSEFIWLWIAIEPGNKKILGCDISKERNMFVAMEKFIAGLTKVITNILISFNRDDGTWYPQAWKFLKIRHHIHSSLEKSLIERTMHYVKDKTEGFDDHLPCKRKNFKLKHVKNWL
jgi:putative transposase